MSNLLKNETSPYLLQHADNPVNWHPWTQSALDLALREDKPILLSIGYAACHWCHVMEHESFEDQRTADVMNQNYICIKVDREERPDLDKIYQLAYQMLNQKPGGWPLNMFLDPVDRVPFFGGTYFPPEPRYGMPSFNQLLEQIAGHYKQHRADLRQQNQRMQDAFKAMATEQSSNSESSLTSAPLEHAAAWLIDHFDNSHGGFGGAPKFPHPTNLERCLRHASFSDNGAIALQMRDMCLITLTRMGEGGLNDHVGGGFFRYSTDARWMIPHFEKMLYDNAQLIPLYLHAANLDGSPYLLAIADKTCAWVCNEMQSVEGGYYSSVDADSEGEEGRFYVWTNTQQIRDLVYPRQWELLKTRYGLQGKANFEGSWHLHAYKSFQEVAEEHGIDEKTVKNEIDLALDKLKEIRNTRIHPALDDKILTAWNGMMIAAMARAGDVLGKAEYISSAERSLAFIRQHLWDNKRLKVTHRNNKSQYNAYLDDYVLLASGIFELLQVRWSDSSMQMLIDLLESVLEHFEDKDNGGFFFTSNDHEKLLTRMKPDTDDAIPSGNGVAASLLLKTGYLIGEQRYIDAAVSALKALWTNINRYPAAHGSLLTALENYLYPPEIIILRGGESKLETWRELSRKNSSANRIVFAIPSSAETLPGLLAAKSSEENSVLAYPCKGMSCHPVISDFNTFQGYLES